MRSRGSTSPRERPAPALILADGNRVAQTTMGTFLGGLILVTAAVGNAAAWAPVAAIAVGSVLGPAWLVLVVRAVRSRVEISTAGVRVRRVFSTRTIPAQDYDGATWNPTIFPSPGASLAVRRKSGRPVSAPTALSMLNNPMRPVDDEIAEIGQLIAAALTGPPAASHPCPMP
ncbi:hypothetical protein N865_05650 [Intrasporangium oryzae NRRL B-24470]|uniref:Uncharacterized protein n=1 Tax=Intrasporangium oryzae NRRL B-24470 TaxID=1386089 RepID=W9G5G3_9MICO|nr:hypothetical protein [Intrasporangium oryzae]EWT01275.1 hypothetical protein N865_05650 [Intrasporangium oryzae NRRL B-24470]